MRTLSSVLTGSQRNSKAITTRRLLGAVGLTVILVGLEAVGAARIPVLWTAGGLSAGLDSAGQAARIATDASGNVAVVSGPSLGRDLAITLLLSNRILSLARVGQPSHWNVQRRLGGGRAEW